MSLEYEPEGSNAEMSISAAEIALIKEMQDCALVELRSVLQTLTSSRCGEATLTKIVKYRSRIALVFNINNHGEISTYSYEPRELRKARLSKINETVLAINYYLEQRGDTGRRYEASTEACDGNINNQIRALNATKEWSNLSTIIKALCMKLRVFMQ